MSQAGQRKVINRHRPSSRQAATDDTLNTARHDVTHSDSVSSTAPPLP